MTEPKIAVSIKSTADVTNKEKKNLVEIIPNQTFSLVYGDRPYYLVKGEKMLVSKEMKAFLNAQNALSVI